MMAVQNLDCKECGEPVVVEIDGMFYPQTLTSPAEYPEVTLVSRGCDTQGKEENDFDPMCTLNDDEIEGNAYSELTDGYRPRRWY